MRMVFVNLPVADLATSKAFYGALGFSSNEQFADDSSASVVISDAIVVMLLTRERFAGFLPEGTRVGDPVEATTQLTALSCDSREEVDAMVERALGAGGKPWMPAQDHGFMYGSSFADPDGHVWEVLWMDPAHVQ